MTEINKNKKVLNNQNKNEVILNIEAIDHHKLPKEFSRVKHHDTKLILSKTSNLENDDQLNHNKLVIDFSKLRSKKLKTRSQSKNDNLFQQIYIDKHKKKPEVIINRCKSVSDISESDETKTLLARLNSNTNRPRFEVHKRSSSEIMETKEKSKQTRKLKEIDSIPSIKESFSASSYGSQHILTTNQSAVNEVKNNETNEEKPHDYKLGPPPHYKVSYDIFIYISPSEVDRDLQIFQNLHLHRLLNVMDLMDAQQVLAEIGNKSFPRDRRMRGIEEKTDCYFGICKAQENGDTASRIWFINGLPRRRITIYSTSYLNIARALSLMEEVFPDIMSSAILTRGIPCTEAGRWSSKYFITSSSSSMSAKRRPQCTSSDTIPGSWFNRIDPSKRHPFHANRSVSISSKKIDLINKSNSNYREHNRSFSFTETKSTKPPPNFY